MEFQKCSVNKSSADLWPPPPHPVIGSWRWASAPPAPGVRKHPWEKDPCLLPSVLTLERSVPSRGVDGRDWQTSGCSIGQERFRAAGGVRAQVALKEGGSWWGGGASACGPVPDLGTREACSPRGGRAESRQFKSFIYLEPLSQADTLFRD